MKLRRISAAQVQGGMLALLAAMGLGMAQSAHAQERGGQQQPGEQQQPGDDQQKRPLAKCDPRDWTHVEVARARVTRAVDGDTVRVMVGKLEYSVRMLSIDTPETKYLGKSQGYWGEVAAEKLAELLPPASWVELRFEKERCDRFGRLLAYVWQGKSNINKEMLRSGLAVNYCIFPADDCGELAPIVQKNIDERRGMFSDSAVELPYEWRRRLRNEDHEKYVGNIFTYEVFLPDQIHLVPVAERVFFLKQTDIKAPYYLVR